MIYDDLPIQNDDFPPSSNTKLPLSSWPSKNRMRREAGAASLRGRRAGRAHA